MDFRILTAVCQKNLTRNQPHNVLNYAFRDKLFLQNWGSLRTDFMLHFFADLHVNNSYR